MNVISFSIFGHNKSYQNSFPFKGYLRCLSINLRMAEIIYPRWRVYLTVDEETYNSNYRDWFDYHVKGNAIILNVVKMEELCLMMLKRMMPIWDGKFDRVLCRDTDSLLHYRERQAVEYWIKTGRPVHAITDSVSHNISLMGGMIGFTCKEFREIMQVDTFKEFIKLWTHVNYNIKGTDQAFLQKVVLPKVADKMVEHYVEGLPQSFRGECYNYIQDDVISDIKPELKESNLLVEHIGQSGFIIEPVLRFVDKHLPDHRKEYYRVIDTQFKDLHYWLL